MTPAALILMIIAILLIWGGLVAAIVHLRSHPDAPDGQEEATEPGVHPSR
ncbi:MAG TPA: methionine/alanine import family NSS transporter small subunit [Beutenbergiaceae bacterium]|nr:methionine/alanine import family NSS transporter small subunit [Beutenbergiaceae bacterium]